MRKSNHRKPRWGRIIPFALACMLALGLVIGLTVNALNDDGADAAGSTSPQASSASQAASKATAKLSSASTRNQTAKIKRTLTQYLKGVTQSGHVAVSFYNLAPVSGSAAAKAADAAVYQAGSLAVAENGDQRMVAASTFKLYITAWLFHELETGVKTWTAADEYGFQRMIVNSENDYAESLLQQSGAAALNHYFATLGTGYVFKTVGTATTTSNDLLTMLKAIERGTGPFADAALRQKLLTAMCKQVYRSGIPAAASAVANGSVVQDKVGWLGSTDNDAGIVTTPHGDRYLLVIMTDNGSYQDFSQVKAIAKQVQTIVYG
ncbi:serine hydrolase [Limosilactobacillus sp.]|uniref:serine hydrolase n=1 Tax=Limosilactobacillus sp. TaxID=2773925 RepID=UPI00359FB0C7